MLPSRRVFRFVSPATTAALSAMAALLTTTALALTHALGFSHRSCLVFAYNHGTTFEPECLAVNQRFGHFPPCRLDDPGKRRTGNLHLCRGLFLVLTIEVGQPQGLHFIKRQCYLSQRADRHPGWLEIHRRKRVVDVSQTTRSWHQL